MAKQPHPSSCARQAHPGRESTGVSLRPASDASPGNRSRLPQHQCPHGRACLPSSPVPSAPFLSPRRTSCSSNHIQVLCKLRRAECTRNHYLSRCFSPLQRSPPSPGKSRHPITTAAPAGGCSQWAKEPSQMNASEEGETISPQGINPQQQSGVISYVPPRMDQGGHELELLVLAINARARPSPHSDQSQCHLAGDRVEAGVAVRESGACDTIRVRPGVMMTGDEDNGGFWI